MAQNRSGSPAEKGCLAARSARITWLFGLYRQCLHPAGIIGLFTAGLLFSVTHLHGAMMIKLAGKIAETPDLPPISRHPAFTALICAWMAALCGLALWVIPIEKLHNGLEQTFAAPLATLPHGLLALLAALTGAALGFLAAQIARRRARHQSKPPTGKARPEPVSGAHPAQILQVDELQLPHGFDNQELLLGTTAAPALAERHGAAVAKLRDCAIADLSLFQLVERFAVALEDRRMAETTGPAPAQIEYPVDSTEIALRDALAKLQQMANAA